MSSTIAITVPDCEDNTTSVGHLRTAPVPHPGSSNDNSAPVRHHGSSGSKDHLDECLNNVTEALSAIELEDRIDKTRESISALERILMRNSKPFLQRFMRHLRVDRKKQPDLEQYYNSFLADHGQNLGPTAWKSHFEFGLYLHQRGFCRLLEPTDSETWRITYLRFPTIQEIDEMAPAIDEFDLGVIESRTPTSLDNPDSEETQTPVEDEGGFNSSTDNPNQNTNDYNESVRSVTSEHTASTSGHGNDGSNSESDKSDSKTRDKESNSDCNSSGSSTSNEDSDDDSSDGENKGRDDGLGYYATAA
ncbi:hypothetical protein GGR57DRAFT_503834 [Xylariaceae sp. FL1272]|nr:hypothetical protein GGR57DRAFT_503834 [Xylariaceae sp. FL1272]